jgi:hypothetical protein
MATMAPTKPGRFPPKKVEIIDVRFYENHMSILTECLDILNNHAKSTKLKQLYDDMISENRKNQYHFSIDLILKFKYIAEDADKQSRLINVVKSLESSDTSAFFKSIHQLSSNTRIDGTCMTVVKGVLYNNKRECKRENTMYSVLSKAILTAIRACEHYIAKGLKQQQELKEKKDQKELEERLALEKIEIEEQAAKEKEEREKEEEKENKKLAELEEMSGGDTWEDI